MSKSKSHRKAQGKVQFKSPHCPKCNAIAKGEDTKGLYHKGPHCPGCGKPSPIGGHKACREKHRCNVCGGLWHWQSQHKGCKALRKENFRLVRALA